MNRVAAITDCFIQDSATDRSAYSYYEWLALSLMTAWLAVIQFADWPIFMAAVFPKFNPSNAYMDSAVFAVAGEMLRLGATPYISYWDHQPPLIHLINAAALTVSQGKMWGIWLASLTSLITALVLGYRTLRHAFGVPSAVFGMSYFVLSLREMLGSNLTEEYGLPLQWAVALLLVRWRPTEQGNFRLGFLLGVLAATLAWLRPTLIGAALAAGCALTVALWSGKAYRGWIRFLGGGIAGAAVITALLLAYLAVHGTLAAFWDEVVRYNLIYIVTTWKMRLRVAYAGFSLVALHGTLLVPMAGWLLALWNVWRREKIAPCWTVLVFAAVWLPMESLFGSLAGREYGHYFIPLLSPLALLAGMMAWQLFSLTRETFARFHGPRPNTIIVAMVLAMWVFPIGDTIATVLKQGWLPKRTAQIRSAVQYIEQHTTSSDRIFVWGQAPDLYFLSARKPATRFIYPFPLLTRQYSDSRLIQTLLDDLRARPPALIIEATDTGVDRADKWVFAEPTGEGLTPSLTAWDAEWRHPDSRRPEFSWWRTPSWWSMTPGLKEFYDFVSTHYAIAEKVGPRGWVIYRRTEPALDRRANR